QEVAEREMGRVLSDAKSRVDVEASAGRVPSALSALPGPIPAGRDSVRIAIVATNDFHGALEPMTPSWAGGDTIGGAANLAAYVRAVEARYPGATLWLDGGDVMQGTLISNLTRGRSTVDVLDGAGLDAAAIGNHEFDWTVDTLKARIDQATFPWLSANVFEKATGKRPDWVEPYAWLEAGGLKVGVIGVSTVHTPQTTMPDHVEPYAFPDPAPIVSDLARELRAEGADLIAVVAHAGAIATDEGDSTYAGEIVDVARRLDGPVDVIVSGHTHTHVSGVVNGIPIVQARSSGTAIGVVTLTWDRSAERVVDSSIDVWTVRAREVDPVEPVAAKVTGYAADVAEIANRPIATLETTLRRNRGEEYALGDLIADAMRTQTGAQVAVMNAGGIRAPLRAGPITFDDVFRVQPFQNLLIEAELTGEQLRLLLEGAVEDRLGQVSGVRFSFDPTRPFGQRVVDATLEEGDVAVVRDGVAVDPDATHTVVVNNYMASGGDEYAVLQDALSTTNTGLVDSEVLAHYLSDLPQPIRYENAGRVTRLAPWPPREE
ncbi:MAG: 5'-nucleotidase C-terminal domain-containing protein, partial [Gemmatimonadota bacterium]|nr:5'-nucleotidase C-terminal domain-containing protein [Gemmatimonadota bacterium]